MALTEKQRLHRYEAKQARQRARRRKRASHQHQVPEVVARAREAKRIERQEPLSIAQREAKTKQRRFWRGISGLVSSLRRGNR